MVVPLIKIATKRSEKQSVRMTCAMIRGSLDFSAQRGFMQDVSTNLFDRFFCGVHIGDTIVSIERFDLCHFKLTGLCGGVGVSGIAFLPDLLQSVGIDCQAK